METKLRRIAEIAKAKPKERFTSLIHLINAETLVECHKEMKAKTSPGVDEVTKEIYEANLIENVNSLIARMKRQAYKPQPCKRVYIPKTGTDVKRPLGIPAYEDKLVQAALAKILNAIYEQDFLECSFGFRPNRGCHDANIYLHYVLDLWFEVIVRKYSKGRAYMVRYADDSIFCFQYEEDALKFYNSLIKRLEKFGLETSKKKYRASLQRCKEWMKDNRTMPTKEFMRTIKSKLQGHCNYYGITDNSRTVGNFIDECRSLIFKWLNRRSQKRSFNWDKFVLFLKKYPLPRAKVYVNIFEIGMGGSYLL